MYPHERSLVKQLNGKPFALIGVNSDGDLDKLRDVIKEKNLTWRSFQNEPEGVETPISDAWGIQGWPTVFIIDAKGVIRWKGNGANDSLIEELLAEMGHEVAIAHEEEEEEESGDEEEAGDGEEEAPAKEADGR